MGETLRGEGVDRKAYTYLVDLWQHLDLGSMQHPQRQADHLQILAPGRRADIPGLSPDIVDD